MFQLRETKFRDGHEDVGNIVQHNLKTGLQDLVFWFSCVESHSLFGCWNNELIYKIMIFKIRT